MPKKVAPQLDRKTQATLKSITRHIPPHLALNLTREEVDTSQEDAAKEALKSVDIPLSTRRHIKRMLDAGKFRTSETVVDETVVAQIDDYHTRAIQQAISSGRLPDPKKDPFIRERSWRARNNRA